MQQRVWPKRCLGNSNTSMHVLQQRIPQKPAWAGRFLVSYSTLARNNKDGKSFYGALVPSAGLRVVSVHQYDRSSRAESAAHAPALFWRKLEWCSTAGSPCGGAGLSGRRTASGRSGRIDGHAPRRIDRVGRRAAASGVAAVRPRLRRGVR